MKSDEESAHATALLLGKRVARIVRVRPADVMIEFEDGSRLHADSETPIELSITLHEDGR